MSKKKSFFQRLAQTSYSDLSDQDKSLIRPISAACFATLSIFIAAFFKNSGSFDFLSLNNLIIWLFFFTGWYAVSPFFLKNPKKADCVGALVFFWIIGLTAILSSAFIFGMEILAFIQKKPVMINGHALAVTPLILLFQLLMSALLAVGVCYILFRMTTVLKEQSDSKP